MDKSNNKKVFLIIAIILVAIFIIGIVAFGVFRLASGTGPGPTYHEYTVDNSILTNETSLEPDHKTLKLESNVKYNEHLTFYADNEASRGAVGHTDSYIFGGAKITFSFHIEDEKYFLNTVKDLKVMVATKINEDDYGEPFLLNNSTYVPSFDKTNHKFSVIFNNDELMNIHSIELKYGVGK